MIAALAAAAWSQGSGSAPPALPPAQGAFPQVPAIPTVMSADLSEPAAPDTYVLGVGDLVDVFVSQMPDLTRQLRLDAQGNIRVPLTAQGIHAAGLTAPALAVQVRQQLVADGIARDPQVDVVVRQVESKPVVVAGAVKNPVTLQLSRPISLVEAIARAGGLAANSGNTVVLTSRPRDGSAVSQRFSTTELLSGDPQDNPMLTGGDLILVPVAQFVYSVGAFNRPGAFPISDGEQLSVLKAIALSQGMKDHASPGKAAILRSMPDGTRQEVPINIEKVMKHQAADSELKAGDVLYLPLSGRKETFAQIVTYSAQAATIAIGYSLGR